ncbi:MAG: LON peptidase substrate-binding domain-containing protein [Candidatus Nealsonbacteria bacterium]|nr:LON peptidase substrate-binding domain-containing protein [Candidatus Nealsonbacteria bacterium]
MSTFENTSFPLDDFAGKVRLFPLPNLVMFPHVMQPLHIFEPRYRDLLEESIADDRLIAMSVLQPNWEKDYDGRPPIYPFACLGRVATYHRLDDGTYNVLLLGLRRIRVLQELKPVKTYREAEVELCEDRDPTMPAPLLRTLHRRLREAFIEFMPALDEAQEQLDQLLGADVPLAVLTDVIAYMLEVKVEAKVELLSEVDVRRRAELLLKHLSKAMEHSSDGTPLVFPPQFSMN